MKQEDFDDLKVKVCSASQKVLEIENHIENLKMLLPNYKKKSEHR